MQSERPRRTRGTAPRVPAPDQGPRPSVPLRRVRAQLQETVDEAARLLEADGGMVYLAEPDGVTLRLACETGVATPERRSPRGLRLRRGHGMFGLAVESGKPVRTGDYAADDGFAHAAGADRLAAAADMRSMVVAPMIAGGTTFGALGVFSRRRDAFSDAHLALVRALAGHAALALANYRLIAELAASRAQLAGRAGRERALRELIASLAAIRDPAVLLQRVVDAAAHVAGAQGAFLDNVSAGGAIQAGFERGIPEEQRPFLRGIELPAGRGLMGRAVAEARTLATDDYLADAAFAHFPESDELARNLGMRAVIAAPLVADGRTLGVLAAYSDRVAAFDADDIALVGAFADHAALAIANAGLIEELGRSREEAARRAAAERGLREIGTRLATFRDPGDLLQYAVDEAVRLADADWAVMAQIDGAGRLRWTHYAQLTSDDLRREHDLIEVHVGEGLLGGAAASRRVLVTGDYLADPRIRRLPATDAFARRAGFRSLVAAPLVTDAGVVGVLGVHSGRPDAFDRDQVALVGAFADHAAIAVGNARLIEALHVSRAGLQESEMRYRGLLAASPDIVFTVDAEGRYTFLSETLERLLGWQLEEVLGKHFGELIDVASMSDAQGRWRELRERPGEVLSARFFLIHRDGRRIPFEIRSSGLLVDGVFAGVQGSARDVSERERLERDLRESEERYRYLVKASPDVVWAVDAQGRLAFLSDRLEQLTGHRPEEMLGHRFEELMEPEYVAEALRTWERVKADPSGVHPLRILMPNRSGAPVPVEIWVTAMLRDGEFAGAHGSIRDMREHERLERELRASEAKYRYLVEESPDIVWSADADGILTFMSDTSERLLGWRPEEVLGQHFSVVIHPDSLAEVREQYETSQAGAPDGPRDLRYRFVARHRDGTRVPLEMHARTIVEGGRYLGSHGAARDIRDRERLERDLRQQAAELAANEERGHLARELHDSVTQALFSMTLVTRSVELLMERDPAAAAARLQTLHELQRDALAEMRALIFELRPASLETEGLVRALRTHAAAVQGRTGLPVVIDADEGERLPGDVEAALFRIAQEALHNVVKHAGARHVHITVERSAGSACLLVEDDGTGFDAASVPAGHLGLAGMRARAEKLGGRLEVRSGRSSGTAIRAEVPLRDAIDDGAAREGTAAPARPGEALVPEAPPAH